MSKKDLISKLENIKSSSLQKLLEDLQAEKNKY